jgi:hypothetical protein
MRVIYFNFGGMVDVCRKFYHNANTHLRAQNSITNHTISSLIKVLKTEKKKHNHRKRLNLLGEEESRLQFFSLS